MPHAHHRALLQYGVIPGLTPFPACVGDSRCGHARCRFLLRNAGRQCVICLAGWKPAACGPSGTVLTPSVALYCLVMPCTALSCRDLRRHGLLGPFVHLHLASDACYIR